MESLQARILVQHKDGGTIAYLYGREGFDLLNIERQTVDNSQFIEIGNILEFEGQKYKVVEINLKLDENLHEMTGPRPGFNMHSPTDERTDYNCQIGVFVERL